MLSNQGTGIINVKEHPELYIVDNNLKGIYSFEPYKSELLPLFKYKSVKGAKRSIDKLKYRFNKYLENQDFIGCNLTLKYLKAGYIFSQRYSRYENGRRYEDGEEKEPLKIKDRDKEKMEITRMYKKVWEEVRSSEDYKKLKKEFRQSIL